MAKAKAKKALARSDRSKHLVVARSVASLSGHGAVGAALSLVALAATSLRERRIRQMWTHVVNGIDDPVEFTKTVEQALLSDGDAVSEGFIAAAKAAADAISPVVVPSIGLLARRFLQTGRPVAREYRGWLSMFEVLDSREYGILRDAVHAMLMLAGEPLNPILPYPKDEEVTTEWRVGNVVLASGGSVEIRSVVAAFQRVVDACRPARTQTIHQKGHVPRDMIELLAEIMPTMQA